ncbi:ABC transporter permease [Desulfosporosinus fructosivorans]|uniref:Transport permease protein n=1 Tax=Desulfosporosinus fructosivorans TaxID=2018669 RepID=A0A4Z0R523_9FIRM|nr:ABC transporter permease [Desulfosporosinus fructosivorans]TGE37107.1 ABC transporter permease [Desulfosporosinus fructosivorans]
MMILSGIRRNFGDTAVLSGRMMRHTFRSIDTLITVVAMPIMMLLMFVYVFGGAMNTGSIDYINFVVPGILLFTIASGVAYTALRLNNDVTSGIFDRFHSMPISKSSILGGHVLNSVVFNMFSVILVLLVALLIGFRPEAGLAEWLLVIGMVLLFTFAMTWVAVTFGLLANSGEGAGVFAYPLLGLLFISSAFAPTESMPQVLRAFAEYQPMTPLIEAVRSLLMNEPVGNNALIAVIWCVGILVASYISAMQIYKRKMA